MNKNIFITGFPGYIASRLIPRIAEYRPDAKMYLLVQNKYIPLANDLINHLVSNFKNLHGKLIPIEGDLTSENLGIDKSKIDLNSITEIFNLAAVYDLRVNKELAYQVNVYGTENLVSFAKSLPNLAKFHHISTCYVAGWYNGEFSEDDFDKGQSFKNFYEETKFISEKIIRENKNSVPFIIYRPSIVIGDSKTGATNKFDGPYPVIFLINKLPKISFMTQVGTGAYPVNLIPVDYVVDGISALSTIDSIYHTYHLCDPEPLTQIQLIELFGKVLRKKLIPIKVKPTFVKKLIRIDLISRLTKLYPEIIDYFDHNLTFRCEKTLEQLEKFNIRPPRLVDYIEKIIAFAVENRGKISSKGIW